MLIFLYYNLNAVCISASVNNVIIQTNAYICIKKLLFVGLPHCKVNQTAASSGTSAPHNCPECLVQRQGAQTQIQQARSSPTHHFGCLSFTHGQGALWIQVWGPVAPSLQFNGLYEWKGNVPLPPSLLLCVLLLSGQTCCRSQPAVH